MPYRMSSTGHVPELRHIGVERTATQKAYETGISTAWTSTDMVGAADLESY